MRADPKTTVFQQNRPIVRVTMRRKAIAVATWYGKA